MNSLSRSSSSMKLLIILKWYHHFYMVPLPWFFKIWFNQAIKITLGTQLYSFGCFREHQNNFWTNTEKERRKYLMSGNLLCVWYVNMASHLVTFWSNYENRGNLWHCVMLFDVFRAHTFNNLLGLKTCLQMLLWMFFSHQSPWWHISCVHVKPWDGFVSLMLQPLLVFGFRLWGCWHGWLVSTSQLYF